MQTILYLLARQQRLLERRVAIEFGPVLGPRTSSLSITELKIKATVPKKRQKQTTKVSGTKNGAAPLMSKAKSKADKIPKLTDETITSKSTSEPTTTDKTSSKSKSKSITEEFITDKRILKSLKSPKDKISPDEKKSTEPSTSDKTTSKLTKDKTKISQSSADELTEDKIYSKSSKGKAYSKSTEDKTKTMKSATDESTEETTYPQSTKKSAAVKSTVGKQSKGKSLLSQEGSDEAIQGKRKQRVITNFPCFLLYLFSIILEFFKNYFIKF